MPEKTKTIELEEQRIVEEYLSSDSNLSIEDYLFAHGSDEIKAYYAAAKRYKETEYAKGCIVN